MMGTSQFRGFPMAGLLLLAVGLSLAVWQADADEIRLKDGKKLYGVIVGYENNMFKVKTDFGYVLVEKDKIAQIVPNAPAPSEKNSSDPSTTPASPAKSDSATTNASEGTPTLTSAVSKTPTASAANAKKEKAAAIASNANARPEVRPGSSLVPDMNAPALKSSNAAPKTTLGVTPAPSVPPNEEPAAAQDEIQGNLYLNHKHGFRMYKAPSWQVIEGAGQTLPNAIVAMGTANESTLLVIGLEKSKGTLEATATNVEKRMRDVYENYRLLSERKTVVGGQPAVEYRYRGLADEHDWSGTLVVVPHDGEILTVLGMTFADSDLIQIQENVIARSIASLDFGVK